MKEKLKNLNPRMDDLYISICELRAQVSELAARLECLRQRVLDLEGGIKPARSPQRRRD